MRKNNPVSRKWLALVLVVFFAMAGWRSVVLAEEFKDIDPSVKDKVAACLVQKGHGNITPVDGKMAPIQNGYFFKINGIDKKTNKSYYMEMICTGEYASWAILAVNEKDRENTLSKNK